MNEKQTNQHDGAWRAAWEAYAELWKLEGPDAKLSVCEDRLDPGCVYTDPMAQTVGWEELVDYMVGFHQLVPGGHFVTTEFRSHNDRCVVAWDLVAGDGTVLDDGVSYGEFNAEGKLKTMTGFFDTAVYEAAAAATPSNP